MRLSAARSRGVALASKPHAARLAAAQARFTLDDARVITAGADGVVLQWRHCRFGAAAEARGARGGELQAGRPGLEISWTARKAGGPGPPALSMARPARGRRRVLRGPGTAGTSSGVKEALLYTG